MPHQPHYSFWRCVLIGGALAVSFGLPLPLLDNALTLPVAQAHHGGGAGGGGSSGGGKGDGSKKAEQPSAGQGKGGRGVEGLKP